MRKTVFLALLLGISGTPLAAQEANVTGRVSKLEKEMRAVQRKVFPGGAQFAEPDIGAPPPVSAPFGDAASEPVTDLTERVIALEAQLRDLTGQSEQNGFKLRQIEEAQGRLDARLKTLEAAGAPISGTESGETVPPRETLAPAAASSPARKSALAAVVKPSTGDAAEDGYTYGYRLWEAKFYPEAQVQLKQTIARYPKYPKMSRARNLLGRAYLDEGKPAAAAKEFVANYEADQAGDRAPHSLYYLGVALTRYGNLAGACKAFAEFGEVYGAKADPTLVANVARGRTEAKCK